MQLLFIKGDRGLVANHNGTFYFPNKTSNIKTEGLYDCSIITNKANYAFVDGHPIKTHLPTVTYLKKLLTENNLSVDDESQLHVKHIGQSIFIPQTELVDSLNLPISVGVGSFIFMNSKRK